MKTQSQKADTYASLPRQGLSSDTLSRYFNGIFSTVHADTDELRDCAYKLRYRIFCEEHTGFEERDKHSDGREKDIYDSNGQTTHTLLIYNPLQFPFGVVRNIFPDLNYPAHSLPIQKLISSPRLHKVACRVNEISRMGRSVELSNIIKQDLADRSRFLFGDIPLNEHPLLIKTLLGLTPLGLTRASFEGAMRKGFLVCVGVMTPDHLERMSRFGLDRPEILGHNVEFHGERTPFLFNIRDAYNRIAQHPLTWDILSREGRNHALAEAIHKSSIINGVRFN